MVMGDDSCSRGSGFESQRCILDGHFFTLICCKNCIVCLKKTENKQKKRPGLAHLKNNKNNHGCGQVVSVLALYPDNQSLNSLEV